MSSSSPLSREPGSLSPTFTHCTRRCLNVPRRPAGLPNPQRIPESPAKDKTTLIPFKTLPLNSASKNPITITLRKAPAHRYYVSRFKYSPGTSRELKHSWNSYLRRSRNKPFQASRNDTLGPLSVAKIGVFQIQQSLTRPLANNTPRSFQILFYSQTERTQYSLAGSSRSRASSEPMPTITRIRRTKCFTCSIVRAATPRSTCNPGTTRTLRLVSSLQERCSTTWLLFTLTLTPSETPGTTITP